MRYELEARLFVEVGKDRGGQLKIGEMFQKSALLTQGQMTQNLCAVVAVELAQQAY
jgi:hypothetical protein